MMKKLGGKNLQVICKLMDNLVNEFNRTYQDAMDEERERENIVRQKSHRKRAVMLSCYLFLPQLITKMVDINEHIQCIKIFIGMHNEDQSNIIIIVQLRCNTLLMCTSCSRRYALLHESSQPN